MNDLICIFINLIVFSKYSLKFVVLATFSLFIVIVEIGIHGFGARIRICVTQAKTKSNLFVLFIFGCRWLSAKIIIIIYINWYIWLFYYLSIISIIIIKGIFFIDSAINLEILIITFIFFWIEFLIFY